MSILKKKNEQLIEVTIEFQSFNIKTMQTIKTLLHNHMQNTFLYWINKANVWGYKQLQTMNMMHKNM